MSRIDEIPDDVLDCRTFIGHSWWWHDVEVKGTAANPILVQLLKCRNCDTIRKVPIEKKTGNMPDQGKGYRYAKNRKYLVKGGRLTDEEKAALRLRVIELHNPGVTWPKRKRRTKKSTQKS